MLREDLLASTTDNSAVSSTTTDWFHGGIEPWLSLSKARSAFLDRAQRELVEGLGAKVRTGLVRTGVTDPCLMYHRLKWKWQNSLYGRSL